MPESGSGLLVTQVQASPPSAVSVAPAGTVSSTQSSVLPGTAVTVDVDVLLGVRVLVGVKVGVLV